MRKWINWSIFGVIGLLLSVLTTVFHFTVLPIAVRYQVTKTLALKNGTDAWDRFVVTPIPLILNIYVFRLDNPNEVLKGEKPKLTQVGPYVYREHWEKVDIRIDEEKDRVFFRQKIDYIFDQELSGNLSDTDEIFMINPVIHMIAEIIDGIPTLNITNELLEFGLSEIMGDFYGPGLKAPLRTLLFDGVVLRCSNDSLSFVGNLFCQALASYMPLYNLEQWDNGDIVATVLKYKQLTPMFEMKRGFKEPDELGKIVAMDGETNLGSWWCDSVNIVDGYDMTLMAPFVEKTSIPLFMFDIRSSIRMDYQRECEFNDIPGYRFVMGKDLMGDPRTNPGSKCFCPGSAKGITRPTPCMPGHGVLNVISGLGVPAIFSNPHFYGASENYKSMIEGLHPDRDLHESFLELEPTTGVPLQGRRRIQVNVLAKRRSDIKLLNNHIEAVIPMMWIDEGAVLGPEQISLLRDQLLYVLQIEKIVRWSLFAVGLAFFVGGISMAIIKKRQETSEIYDVDED